MSLTDIRTGKTYSGHFKNKANCNSESCVDCLCFELKNTDVPCKSCGLIWDDMIFCYFTPKAVETEPTLDPKPTEPVEEVKLCVVCKNWIKKAPCFHCIDKSHWEYGQPEEDIPCSTGAKTYQKTINELRSEVERLQNENADWKRWLTKAETRIAELEAEKETEEQHRDFKAVNGLLDKLKSSVDYIKETYLEEHIR